MEIKVGSDTWDVFYSPKIDRLTAIRRADGIHSPSVESMEKLREILKTEYRQEKARYNLKFSTL